MAKLIAYLIAIITVIVIIMCMTGLGFIETIVSIFFCALFCCFRR